MKKGNDWARLLAYVTGLVNQQLLLQNEYLAAENRILRAHLPSRLRLSDPERSTLAEIGKRLGRKALKDVACVAKPDTILAWYRRLVAKKFDGSKSRSYPGRPRISREVTDLIVQMAKDNSGWGYDRIVGALANLGHVVSDQTVGNILRRHGIAACSQTKSVNSRTRSRLKVNGSRTLREPAVQITSVIYEMDRLPMCSLFAPRLSSWQQLVTQPVLIRTSSTVGLSITISSEAAR